MVLTHCAAGNMRELPCRGTLDVCTWQTRRVTLEMTCGPVGWVCGQCNIRSANRTSTTMVTVVTG